MEQISTEQVDCERTKIERCRARAESVLKLEQRFNLPSKGIIPDIYGRRRLLC